MASVAEKVTNSMLVCQECMKSAMVGDSNGKSRKDFKQESDIFPFVFWKNSTSF